jgi:hypothetical protein
MSQPRWSVDKLRCNLYVCIGCSQMNQQATLIRQLHCLNVYAVIYNRTSHTNQRHERRAVARRNPTQLGVLVSNEQLADTARTKDTTQASSGRLMHCLHGTL